MLTTDRRMLLAALSASLLTPAGRSLAAGALGIRFGPTQDFSFEWLSALAQKNAGQPYRAPQSRASRIIQAIDFDAVQKIKFRADHALWAHGPGPYPVSLFHLNKYSADPVTIHEVESGKAREILYSPDYFDYGASGLDPKELEDLGFAGFRVMDGQS